jgi:AcrR family transcriptional regulator
VAGSQALAQRRKPWNGNSPETPEEARRFLLDVARACIDRLGPSKAGLSDVASAAGVTRQTVYRYFVDADDLFNTAAVLTSGGFLERIRERVLEHEGTAERIVETVVLAIREIPRDAQLSSLVRSSEFSTISSALKLSFVQEEMLQLSDGDLGMDEAELDELAEILLRLLDSFLGDPGPERGEEELRAFLYRWFIPMIDSKLD